MDHLPATATTSSPAAATAAAAAPQRTTSEPRIFAQPTVHQPIPPMEMEEERLEEYTPERYYPVRLGEVFHGRYQVLVKLGYGASSTIWLCRDLQEHRYLTLKVHVRSGGQLPEVEVSKWLRVLQQCDTKSRLGQSQVRLTLDSFQIQGPHGMHTCLLYAPAGMDLGDFLHLLPGHVFPGSMVKNVAYFILLGLHYLHTSQVVHTDVQPGNILLRVDNEAMFAWLERTIQTYPPPQKVLTDRIIYPSVRMYQAHGPPVLTDLGDARYGRRTYTGLIMPSVYRAPEVIVGMEWDEKVDIWGLGLTLWTLLEHTDLFADLPLTHDSECAQRFAQMIALLGPATEGFWSRYSECHKYWDTTGEWKGRAPIPAQTLEGRLTRLEGKDKALFLRMLRKMLAWSPAHRPSARELLEEEWLMS